MHREREGLRNASSSRPCWPDPGSQHDAKESTIMERTHSADSGYDSHPAAVVSPDSQVWQEDEHAAVPYGDDYQQTYPAGPNEISWTMQPGSQSQYGSVWPTATAQTTYGGAPSAYQQQARQNSLPQGQILDREEADHDYDDYETPSPVTPFSPAGGYAPIPGVHGEQMIDWRVEGEPQDSIMLDTATAWANANEESYAYGQPHDQGRHLRCHGHGDNPGGQSTTTPYHDSVWFGAEANTFSACSTQQARPVHPQAQQHAAVTDDARGQTRPSYRSGSTWSSSTAPAATRRRGTRGKPAPRQRTVSQTTAISAASATAADPNNQFACIFPGCSAKKPFGRVADLDRHMKFIHFKETAQAIFCDYPKCDRKEKPFHRLDHLREHLRDVHKEDLFKRGQPLPTQLGSTADGYEQDEADDHDGGGGGGGAPSPAAVWREWREWWKIRAPKAVWDAWWRCKECLTRVSIEADGYACPKCKSRCEMERQAMRRELPLSCDYDGCPSRADGGNGEPWGTSSAGPRLFYRCDELRKHLRDWHDEDLPLPMLLPTAPTAQGHDGSGSQGKTKGKGKGKKGQHAGATTSVPGHVAEAGETAYVFKELDSREWWKTRVVDPRWWRCNRCMTRAGAFADGWACPHCFYPCDRQRIEARGYPAD
ncbi:hypothetical protein VTK73DRAFT_6912 [Phialemonium thermophilum]|uniref:C2H2-type domain-containing protein n=1 Tax=Phialemonium thermophilum TaxID=223376 RepID=A0ABR3WHB8_9PEZI